jgi:hypothetical protein
MQTCSQQLYLLSGSRDTRESMLPGFYVNSVGTRFQSTADCRLSWLQLHCFCCLLERISGTYCWCCMDHYCFFTVLTPWSTSHLISKVEICRRQTAILVTLICRAGEYPVTQKLSAAKGKVPVLNQLNTTLWRCMGKCIDRRILDLDTCWRWVVSFTPRQLYPEERAPNIH